ncbi:hypothetical protein J0A67_17200 [Algoriphagus aestuariicola]|uniref:Uncharacterized protein n=1 Tax=Algoriphagus aestuariicola TaxID=1852016 RepID=A0ABS3BTQ4_9BACT|nr:hypothetical protein [Algoriphagus aestuariicola]MBN7802616.1 hypothetical protein [Algoriphagus aestuariicola]
MRVFGILFLFLNLAIAVSIWSGNIPVASNPDSPAPGEIFYPTNFLQQSISLEVGDGLPFGYVPQRPVARTVQYFFEPQSIPNPYSGLSACCILKGNNKQGLPMAISISLPDFLTVCPHHCFT